MRNAAIAVLVLIVATDRAAAADARKIRTANIGAQAVMTLVSAAVQGNIHGGRDILRCVLGGSLSGYGFYESKVMAGDNRVHQGWLVANVSGSISENVAAGKNAFAQLGYSIGPFRIRVPIPRLDPDADSYVYVDASEYEAISLVRAIRDNDRMRFRGGLIAFERDSVYPSDDSRFVTIGSTYGMFPGVSPRANRFTWPHEVVHAIQSLQGDSVEPSFSLLTYRPKRDPNQPKRLLRFEHLKAGVVNLGIDGLLSRQPYADRWTEIEAFRLSEDVAPPR